MKIYIFLNGKGNSLNIRVCQNTITQSFTISFTTATLLGNSKFHLSKLSNFQQFRHARVGSPAPSDWVAVVQQHRPATFIQGCLPAILEGCPLVSFPVAYHTMQRCPPQVRLPSAFILPTHTTTVVASCRGIHLTRLPSTFRTIHTHTTYRSLALGFYSPVQMFPTSLGCLAALAS